MSISPGHEQNPSVIARANRAFTLVELLTVIAVIAVLLALIAPAVNSIVRGPLLTQTSDELAALLSLARQTAASSNQKVEVRFYQYALSNQPGETSGDQSTWKFRAAQLFAVGDNGRVTALNRVRAFPEVIIADRGAALSPLLFNTTSKTFTGAAGGDPKISLPGVGTSYNCRAFRFRPDGSTDLSPPLPVGTWFITLHNARNGDALNSPPSDYATLQIDPISGTRAVYRP